MMKEYKKICLMAALVMASLNMAAAGVDAAAARVTAAQFLQSQRTGRFMTGNTGLQLSYTCPSAVDASLADYYVFNASGGGFVIVAGDDRANNVLAYGDKPLDINNLPCNMTWLLDLYREQMEYLHAHPTVSVKAPSKSSSLIVEPLLPSNWSQGAPYYNMCPVVQGKHCVTGCVATAMAQVMYYWKFPNELPDLVPYTTPSYGIYIPGLPPTTLDWDNMLDHYLMDYGPEHGRAVATLMRYCGQACYMDYGTDGSGAACKDQVAAMRMFNYNPACRLHYRDEYEADAWSEMMQNDLAAHRPILYSGFGDAGGHAFVVDGFDGTNYHINWGWAGNADGYFQLDAFDPAGMSFSWNQQMITELYPFIYGENTDPYDFEVDGLYYKQHGDGVTLVCPNPSGSSYSGNVTIPSTVTHDGKTFEVTAIGNNAFKNCYGLTRVTIPNTVRTIGTYAFENCIRLTSVSIPASVEKINYAAFMECISLSSVTLADGVKEIGYYAFAWCIRLQRINIPNSVTTLSRRAFFACSGLKKAAIGDGVETVGAISFADCTSLTDLTIGNGTHLIEERAFYGCTNLKNVTMGFSVDSIGEQAFYRCNALNRLIMWPELPPLTASENCFSQKAYENATVYAMDDFSLEDYTWAEVWTLFAHHALINDLPPDDVPGDVNGDGEVTVADVNAVIEVILTGGTDLSGDVNGDGEVSIADVNAVIDIILHGA